MKSINKFLVNEATGEYPELDRISESFWKTLFLGFKERSQIFDYKEYPKETALISSAASGIKFVVRVVPSMERNAFVIPGIDASDFSDWNKRANKWKRANRIFFLNIPPMAFVYLTSIDRLLKLKNYQLVETSNGKKKFAFKESDLTINVFATYGLLQHLSKGARTAIYLHELGHWIDAAKNIPVQMIKDDKERIYYWHKTMLSRVANMRYEELEADNYARIAGYGKELIEGLNQLIEPRDHVTWLTKINDSEIAAAVEADNRLEAEHNKFRIDQYPSIEKRKQELEKNDKSEKKSS